MRVSRLNLLAGVLFAGLMVANVVFSYMTFTAPYPGFNDFMTPWEAGRGFFYDGINPYSAEASLNIQTRLYGRAALPDEQPNHFAYPFYTVLVVWPLIHVDYAWATAIWLVFNEALLGGALLLLLNLYGWRPRPLMITILLLFTLFAYPAARGLILGQVSHLVYFLQVLAIWALAKDRDRLAGVALAVSTFKPQMGVLIVPFLLLWGLQQRRWPFVAAFGTTFGALVAASFLLLPGWAGGFLDQVLYYPSYIEVSTPAWVVGQYLLGLGRGAELALNALGLALLLWAWYGVLVQRRDERLTWTLMLTLTITHLIGLRTATPHFVVFIIPLVFYLRHLARRRLALLTLGLLAALTVLPWLHFLTTIGDAKFEHPTTFLPIPLLTLAALLLTRRLWWDAPPLIASHNTAIAGHPTHDDEAHQPA